MDDDTPNAEAVEYYVRLCRELGVECCLEVLAAVTTPSRSCSLTDRATPLRDADIKAIAGMLRQYDVLDILNVEGNEIDQDGILSVANMLKNNESLHTLRLGANRFRDGGVITLAHALQVNQSLTSLDISHNRIGGVGCKALAGVLRDRNASLQELVLHGNVVDGHAVTHLTSALCENKSIQHLHLGYNDLCGRGALAVATLLKSNNLIATLDISNNRITDHECAVLVRNLGELGGSPVERLNLRSNLLGEKTFTALAEILPRSRLRELFVGYNKPSQRAVVRLLEAAASAPYLSTLDVHGSPVPGAACLRKLLCNGAGRMFCCLLLDGVTCASEKDMEHQMQVWEDITRHRKRVEVTRNLPKIYVGKESDKVDGVDSSGPAFFVGDIDVLFTAAASSSVKVEEQTNAHAQAVEQPQQSQPRMSTSSYTTASSVGPSFSPSPHAPAASDDPMKRQLSSQVAALEKKLETERGMYQRQLQVFEERLRSLEGKQQEVDTSSLQDTSRHEVTFQSAQTLPQDNDSAHTGSSSSGTPTSVHLLSSSASTAKAKAHANSNKNVTAFQQQPPPPVSMAESSRKVSPPRSRSATPRRAREIPEIKDEEHHLQHARTAAEAVQYRHQHQYSYHSYQHSVQNQNQTSRTTSSNSRSQSPLRDRPSACPSAAGFLSPPPPPPHLPTDVALAHAACAVSAQHLLSSHIASALFEPSLSHALPPRASTSSAVLQSNVSAFKDPQRCNSRLSAEERRSSSLSVGDSMIAHSRAAFGSLKKSPPCPVQDAVASLAVPQGRRGVASGGTKTLREPLQRGRSPCPVPAGKSLLGDVREASVGTMSDADAARQSTPTPPLPTHTHSRPPSPAPFRRASPTPHSPDPCDMPHLVSAKPARGRESRGAVSPRKSTRIRRPSRSPRPIPHDTPVPNVPVLQDSKRQGEPHRSRSRHREPLRAFRGSSVSSA